MIKQLKNIFDKENFVRKKRPMELNINGSFAQKSLMSNAKLFIENPCVRRSVNVIATAISAVKFKVFRDGKFVSDHSLYDLLNRPNGTDSLASFMEGLVTNFMIFGNAYVAIIDGQNGQELHNLNPEKMTIIPGPNGVPLRFEYEVDGKIVKFDNNGFDKPVGHLKTFNPQSNWYGISPLDAVRVSANLHHSITLHNLSLINNGGRVGGVVALKKGANRLSEKEKESIRHNLVQMYQGPENAGRIAFVEGGDFEWKPMGASVMDMDYINAKTLAAREISEALGVPAILIGGIGMKGEAAHANFREIIDRFHEGTILPLAQRIFSFLNNWLVRQIDPNASLQIDHENFLPLNDKRFELWEKVSSADFLSEKEKRALLGLENIINQTQAANSQG